MADVEANEKIASDSVPKAGDKNETGNENIEDFDSIIKDKFNTKGDNLSHSAEKLESCKQKQIEKETKHKVTNENQDISSNSCKSRKSPIVRFESRQEKSARKVKWSPPRTSRSPEICSGSSRRISCSPLRSPRTYSRSPKRHSRSPRRNSKSPRRRSSRLSISPGKRSLSPKPLHDSTRKFSISPDRRGILLPSCRRNSRSPIRTGKRFYNDPNIYRCSRSPSVEFLDDSREKIMTMKAKVVETGLVPPGMEMEFDLVTMCQNRGVSKASFIESRTTAHLELKSNECKRIKGMMSRYLPPARRISPESIRYRTFLEEIEDTFACNQMTSSSSKETKDKSRKFTNPFANTSPFFTNSNKGQTDLSQPIGLGTPFMFQHATQLVSELKTTPSAANRIQSIQKENQQDEVFKLYVDKKNASPKVNLNSTEKPKTIQNKINVISQCQNAIKLLSGDIKGGHFNVQDASQRSERTMDLKGICPFRKVRTTRFQYTSKLGGVEKPDDVATLLNQLLTNVGKGSAFETAVNSTGEVIDLCTSPRIVSHERRQMSHASPISIDLVEEKESLIEEKKESPLIEKMPPSLFRNPVAVGYKQQTTGMRSVASIAIQTEARGCAECQKRKNILHENVYTQTNDNSLNFDIGCQTNLDDMRPKSPRSILKRHSLAQLTPVQLLQQRNESEFLPDKFELTPDFLSSKRARLSNTFLSDLKRAETEEKVYSDLLSSNKRPGASAFFDLPSSSYKPNRFEDIAPASSKLYSRDRPQMSRSILGSSSSLPFSSFDPKLNFDATKWTKKY